jgi:hypothetical protein
MDQIPCPDGYLLDAKSPLAGGHHTLNDYLVRVEDAGWKLAIKEVNAIRDKKRKVRTWLALLERLEWLRANGSDQYFKQLHDLMYSIEKWKIPLTGPELIEILQRTGRLAGRAIPDAPMPHLMAFVEEHGLTEPLSAAIREFADHIRREKPYVNQVRRQLLNSRLDMLAWQDEWNGIDLKRCWSEQVRADFRLMRGVERENWRRLLHSIHGEEGVTPAPKWLRGAGAVVREIGPAAFSSRTIRWFAPLQPGAAQRLSREGSYLLRAFIWLARHENDPDVMAKVAEIPSVLFQPRTNGEKVVRTAAAASGQPDPGARAAVRVPNLDDLTARALSAVFSTTGFNALPLAVRDRVRIEDGTVLVRGQLDSYRVHLSSGAIFRESDGMRVFVRAGATPWQVPPPLAAIGPLEIVAQILILAEDARHLHALSDSPG